MSNTVYSRAVLAATRVLKKFGQPITFTAPRNVFDPLTGTMGGAVTVPRAGFGVVLEYNIAEVGGNILRGDLQVYVSPGIGVSPSPGDTLTLADGTALTVVISSPVAPAGVVVLHNVQCRGAALPA